MFCFYSDFMGRNRVSSPVLWSFLRSLANKWWSHIRHPQPSAARGVRLCGWRVGATLKQGSALWLPGLFVCFVHSQCLVVGGTDEAPSEPLLS